MPVFPPTNLLRFIIGQMHSQVYPDDCVHLHYRALSTSISLLMPSRILCKEEPSPGGRF